MIRRKLKWLGVVALGSGLYYLASGYLLPWSGLLVIPLGKPAGYVTYLVWLQAANLLVLTALSLPFAVALSMRRVVPALPVATALVVALCGLVAPVAFRLALPIGPSGVSALVDLAKFVVVLPGLTWLVGNRLPSNNSSKPTPLRGAA